MFENSVDNLIGFYEFHKKKNQLNYTCAIYYTNIQYEEQAPNKEYYVIGKRYFSEGTVKIGDH